MEERKSFLWYIKQAFFVFGITMGVMMLFTWLVGEEAQEISSMYALGNKGVPISVMAEYLVLSFFIMGFRFLFFTDCLIKNLKLVFRTIGMVLSVIVTIGIFAFLFHWFPVDNMYGWIMFLVCFGICFLGSTIMTHYMEKKENKELEEALRKYQENVE